MDVRPAGSAAALAATRFAGAASAAGSICTPPGARVACVVRHLPKLRRLDTRSRQLYDSAESETRGIEGETGQLIDPFGSEHRRWLARSRSDGPTESGLASAYQTRIVYVRLHWAAASLGLSPISRPGCQLSGA